MNVQPWAELHEADQGPVVRGMQYLLRQHGSEIPADGDFGPVTADAVRRFQAARGLAPDGIVRPITWAQLVVVTGPGDTGEAVRGVQSFGLTVIPQSEPLVVDGEFGPVTESRVRLFQQLWGLTTDGFAGPETWSYLTADRTTVWPLVRPGDSGEAVRALQAVFPALEQDGIFGPNTEGEVRDFQQMFGLTVDGIAGPQTWRYLMLPRSE